MERITLFEPAWDRRDPDSKKNYGIHGVTLFMALKGERGAVVFCVFTQWHLPYVIEGFRGMRFEQCLFQPMGVSVSYHAPAPRYEGDESAHDDCEWVPGGGPCYGGEHMMMGNEFMSKLIAEGGEAVWKALEAEYGARFGELA